MRFLFVASLIALTLAGCGSKAQLHEVQPVDGQVLWKGKPLEGAVVIFYPQGWQPDDKSRAPRAQSGPDGKFHVGTYGAGDGAPEGQYVVTVVHCPLVKQGSDSVPGPNLLPSKYASPKTSDLRAEVVKGGSTLPVLALK